MVIDLPAAAISIVWSYEPDPKSTFPETTSTVVSLPDGSSMRSTVRFCSAK